VTDRDAACKFPVVTPQLQQAERVPIEWQVILVTHYRRLMRSSMLVKAAVGGVALEYVYAYMVSDVFSGARMYLAPLAVSLVAVASLDDAESTDKGRIGAYPPSSRALYVLSRKSR